MMAPLQSESFVVAGIPAPPSFVAEVENKWWKIADGGVLATYAAIVLWTIQYHEKWADEAQAWLIARDLNLKTIWFHELRYEGSPGLWHTILWVAQHVFHARYDAIGYIGAAFAIAGVALLIFKAPFPRYISWPLAFTYVLVYQYAVIARPYTLLPLFAFGAAALFREKVHPEGLTLVLVLLANLSVHGTILAGCLGLLYLVDGLRIWSTFDREVKHRYWISAAAMLATFIFIAVILKPTPDVEEFALKRGAIQISPSMQSHLPTAMQKVGTIIAGAFLDWLFPSVLFLVLVAVWFVLRKRLSLFLLLVGPMVVFYAKVHGAAHHQGTAFVALVTALWLAWPSRAELADFSIFDKRAFVGMKALLLCLCAVNVWDAAVVIDHEFLYPYSGAADAAKYLKSVAADQKPMFGFLMGVAGVEAYFDHNIFVNLPTTYFHHGLPLTGARLDFDELRRVRPAYIVAYTQDPELMLRVNVPALRIEGYDIVHVSDGYYLYKRGVFERDVYLILRRLSDDEDSKP